MNFRFCGIIFACHWKNFLLLRRFVKCSHLFDTFSNSSEISSKIRSIFLKSMKNSFLNYLRYPSIRKISLLNLCAFKYVMNQQKMYSLNLNIFFTDESVKRQITDSISENLTDSDLESMLLVY